MHIIFHSCMFVNLKKYSNYLYLSSNYGYDDSDFYYDLSSHFYSFSIFLIFIYLLSYSLCKLTFVILCNCLNYNYFCILYNYNLYILDVCSIFQDLMNIFSLLSLLCFLGIFMILLIFFFYPFILMNFLTLKDPKTQQIDLFSCIALKMVNN